MTTPAAPDDQGSSTRPYLIRALHDWCTDNGFTPYIAVFVDRQVQVPMEYVKNNEIVLNVGFEATSGLKLGKTAAPLMKYAERIFSRPAFIEALTPSEKVMRK